MKQFNKACIIGRFQPTMHIGHINMIKTALDVASTVYILIGSSNKYPGMKNPIPSSERHKCILSILEEEFPIEVRNRIHIKCINDYKYNDEKWKTEVRYKMDERRTDKIAMIGFDKDEDSYWLHEFGWHHVAIEPTMINWFGNNVPMSSTFIRDHWLRTGDVILKEMLHPVCIDFLHRYTWNDKMEFTSEFDRLNEERLKWDAEKKKFRSYPYPEALHACCADSVVICNNHILLIERKFAPGKGAMALPGGHKEANETFRYAALRELEEEVKIKVPSNVLRGSIVDSQLFDDPKRTDEFCKPTVAQYIILKPDYNGKLPKIKADSDAKRAEWVPLHEVKRNPSMLFDDHAEIIDHFTGLL